MKSKEELALIKAGDTIQNLKRSLSATKQDTDGISRSLKNILTRELWRERFDPDFGEVVKFNSFQEFLTADPPEGLNRTVQAVERLIVHDTELLLLFDRAIRAKSGNPHRNSTDYNIHNSARPAGTSRRGTLRRLDKDHPELLKQVIKGNLSANAAAIEAGFRKQPLNALEQLEKAWAKASKSERAKFIKQVTQKVKK